MMVRLLGTWMLLLLLAACSRPVGSSFSPPSDSDRALFFQGLDELATAETSPALSELAGRPDQGPWQRRARILLAWQSRLRDQEHHSAADLHQKLRSCRSSNDKLTQENATLHHDLQELKRIMVEMEKRGK